MSPQSIDAWVSRYARRLWWGDYLGRAAEIGAAALFAFGGLVLITKLLFPAAWPHVLWLAVGGIPAAIAAGWMASRCPWSRSEATARLDAALGTGGLLMTLAELPDNEWQARLPQVEKEWREALPRLRPRRFASYLALPLLFAVGACFVPLRAATSRTLTLNSTAQKATQELEQLLEEVIKTTPLEPEEQKQLEKELEQLAEEARTTPLTHEKWEAVDALRERLTFRVEEARQQVAKAQSLAEKLAMIESGELSDVSTDQVEQLQKELAETLQKLNQQNALQGLSEDDQNELQRLMKDAGLTSESMPGEDPEERLDSPARVVTKPGLKTPVSKTRLPKPGSKRSGSGETSERQEALNSLKELLESESKKLSELRDQCKSSLGNGELEGECEGNQSLGQSSRDGDGRPGRGGLNRGRADADMSWGDEADETKARFKETVLPQSDGEDDPKNEILSLQRRDPIAQPADAGPRSAQRNKQAASGSTTVNRNLSPRHRQVIRKYFDEK